MENLKEELIDFLKIKSIQSLSVKEIEKLHEFIKWLNSLNSLNSLPNGEASRVSNRRGLLIAFAYWFDKNVQQRDNFIFKVEEFMEQPESNL